MGSGKVAEDTIGEGGVEGVKVRGGKGGGVPDALALEDEGFGSKGGIDVFEVNPAGLLLGEGSGRDAAMEEFVGEGGGEFGPAKEEEGGTGSGHGTRGGSGGGGEAAVFGSRVPGHVAAVDVELGGEGWVGGGEDLNGEEAGILGIADGHGGDRNAAGHLDDGEEGVEAFKGFGFDGNPDDGKDGVAGGHAGKMGGTARSGDDDLESAFGGGLGVTGHVVGGAVGGDDFDLEGDVEGLADVSGGGKGGEIGVAAHDDADEGLTLVCFHREEV